MKVSDFLKKSKFSEASGVSSFIEPKIQIRLNHLGLYEETIDAPSDSDLSPLVEKVSPYLNSIDTENLIAKKLYSNNKNIKYDERIGYYNSLYIGHVLEGSYRKNASSGGVGTWIFKALLDDGLIDGVIHVKRNSDRKSKILYKYEISRTIEEVKEGAKTRYYPVELSEVLEVIKNNEGRYAVVGIPSFIKAIRLVCQYDPIIYDRIAFTVGLICGHQKSSKFAEYMAWQVGIKPGDLEEIDFRHKLEGYPADAYAIKMTGKIDGVQQTIIMPKNDLDGQNWGLGYFKTIASDFTSDVFNETADIVIGDAWLPEYSKDSLGNNIVIIRNELINTIVSRAIKDKKVNLQVTHKDRIFESQAAHYRHTHDELPYRLNKEKKKGSWVPHFDITPSANITKSRAMVQDMRMKLSEQSHIHYEKAVRNDDLNYFIKKMEKLNKKYKVLYYYMSIRSKGVLGTIKHFLKKLA